MAASYSCDGCGTKVDEPHIVGNVIKREYCEPCARKAEAFLEAEELVVQASRANYLAARRDLIAGASADNFKLPDVP